MGDEDLAKTIIEGFLMDIPNQIQTLGKLLENGDISEVERQAHMIKGAAGNVGGEVLREAAYDMERAANKGDLDIARASMQEIENRFKRLKQYMDAYLNDMK